MKERLIEFWRSKGIDERLIEAFREVPRESFIDKADVELAYADHPLEIGEGQTISQPTTIMLMLQALELKKGDKVLEIGAGSGYNAALIAQLASKVYTVEYSEKLTQMAEENLKRLEIDNVEVIQGDGSQGYPKEAPYDKIIVTAAAPQIPWPLLDQLKDGGILVIPVGEYTQKMIRARKDGDVSYEELGYFQFVPLQGKFGFDVCA